MPIINILELHNGLKMKNIESNIGGRYRYNEDFRSIQNAALALTETLKECNCNFVISGCKNNQDGFVWLDGKIRYVPSLNGTQTADYIVCKDFEGPSVLYGDDKQHKLYDDFEAQYSDTKVTPCISKENGNFPTIKEYFWEHYGLAKNATKEQSISSRTFFNNGMECSKILIDNVTTLSITNDEICIESSQSGISLSTKLPVICIRKNGKTVSALGGKEATNKIFGKLQMPKMIGNNLVSNGRTNAQEYFIDKNIRIGKVLQAAKHHIDTGWLPFIRTKSNKRYNPNEYGIYDRIPNSQECLLARQFKDKVFVKGFLWNGYITNEIDETIANMPIKYKKLAENNDYANVLTTFPTHEVSKNGYEVDKSLAEDERPQIVKLKLNLKLPDEITPPDANRLPGCLIMGIVPEDFYDYINSGCDDEAIPPIQNYYSIGNAQLTLGNDRFLYLIIGTNHKLYFEDGCAVINFNYLV